MASRAAVFVVTVALSAPIAFLIGTSQRAAIGQAKEEKKGGSVRILRQAGPVYKSEQIPGFGEDNLIWSEITYKQTGKVDALISFRISGVSRSISSDDVKDFLQYSKVVKNNKTWAASAAVKPTEYFTFQWQATDIKGSEVIFFYGDEQPEWYAKSVNDKGQTVDLGRVNYDAVFEKVLNDLEEMKKSPPKMPW